MGQDEPFKMLEQESTFFPLDLDLRGHMLGLPSYLDFVSKNLSDIENKLMVTKEEKAGVMGINEELGISRYKPLYMKQIQIRCYCIAQGTVFNIL